MISKIKPILKAGDTRIRSAHGFTLTELLVVIAMIAIFTPALYFTMSNLLRSYTTENAVGGIQQTARYAIEYMVRDIRMAGFDPLSADVGIEEARNKPEAGTPTVPQQKIRIRADHDSSGVIEPGNFEEITYRYDPDASELLLQFDELGGGLAEEVLVENVTDFRFSFFDDENVPVGPLNSADVALIDDIQIVQIDLTVEEPAGIVGQRERTYTSRVSIRNKVF